MSDNPSEKRRDFLQLSTITLGAVGTAAFIWPFLKSMSPAEDTLAFGTSLAAFAEEYSDGSCFMDFFYPQSTISINE